MIFHSLGALYFGMPMIGLDCLDFCGFLLQFFTRQSVAAVAAAPANVCKHFARLPIKYETQILAHTHQPSHYL
jgi:hypothetical protein